MTMKLIISSYFDILRLRTVLNIVTGIAMVLTFGIGFVQKQQKEKEIGAMHQ